MSLHEYLMSQRLEREDYPFYSLVMAMLRKADTGNVAKIKAAWPGVYDEMMRRYHAPGGALTPEELEAVNEWHSRQKGNAE